jgi:signal transduction histidine kinase
LKQVTASPQLLFFFNLIMKLGGKMTIESAPGKGLIAIIEIPINE